MKPYEHALSSVKKFGGKVEDYLKIHNWFDQSKAFMADHRHRCILHSSFGIFLCEQFFGVTITNSDNKIISTRSIGEQHVSEDFGGKFIPSVQDWLENLQLVEWMDNGKNGLPSSYQRIAKAANITVAAPNITFDHDLSDVTVDGSAPFINNPSKPISPSFQLTSD